jgi:hypothetical protein
MNGRLCIISHRAIHPIFQPPTSSVRKASTSSRNASSAIPERGHQLLSYCSTNGSWPSVTRSPYPLLPRVIAAHPRSPAAGAVLAAHINILCFNMIFLYEVMICFSCFLDTMASRAFGKCCSEHQYTTVHQRRVRSSGTAPRHLFGPLTMESKYAVS